MDSQWWPVASSSSTCGEWIHWASSSAGPSSPHLVHYNNSSSHLYGPITLFHFRFIFLADNLSASLICLGSAHIKLLVNINSPRARKCSSKSVIATIVSLAPTRCVVWSGIIKTKERETGSASFLMTAIRHLVRDGCENAMTCCRMVMLRRRWRWIVMGMERQQQELPATWTDRQPEWGSELNSREEVALCRGCQMDMVASDECILLMLLLCYIVDQEEDEDG